MVDKDNAFAPEKRPGYFGAVIGIIKTGYALVSSVNETLKPFGLTEPQYNVLSTLHSFGTTPICLHTIRSHMIQKDSNVSRIVDKLVERQLVTRTICAENRRKMDVLLSREGRRLFLKAARAVRSMHARLAACVSETEAAQVRDFLGKLYPDAAKPKTESL